MNSTDPLNTYFKKIVDSEGESKLLAGLAGLGVILPQGFEVLVGHVNIRSQSGARPVVDDFGAHLKIKAGKRVLYSAAVFRQDGNLGTYTFGAAATPSGVPAAPFLDAAVDVTATPAFVAGQALVGNRFVEVGSSDQFVTLNTSVTEQATADAFVDVFIVLV